MLRYPRFSISVAVICLIAFSAPTILAQPLFIETTAQDLANKANEPKVIRERQVTIDFSQLTPDNSLTLELNLFTDLSLIAVPDYSEYTAPNGFIWTGHILGEEFSTVVFSVLDGVVIGKIRIFPGEFYQILFIEGAVHSIREVDAYSFTPEAEPLFVDLPDIGIDLSAGSTSRDDETVIDVMILYTTNARVGAGGVAAIEASIYLALHETNVALTQSNIDILLQLVHTAEIAYPETGSPFQDVQILQAGASGVHALRDLYCADLVSIIVEAGGQECGAGYSMTVNTLGFAPYAYSVVVRECALQQYSLAHEIGHNMGGLHDWYADDRPDSPFSYNHGYVYSTDRWFTIMGRELECRARQIYCERIPYFSNPNIDWNSVPIGIEEPGPTNCLVGELAPDCVSEVWKAFNITRHNVSSFRNTCPGIGYVWLRDTWFDTGLEPDPNQAGQDLWQSPYIWIRLEQDPDRIYQHEHENPEFGQDNYVYVKMHNSSASPVTGTLHMYWAQAATGLEWQTNWQEIGTGIPVIDFPGISTAIVETVWDDVPPPVHSPDHYCLLARFESAVDPIHDETDNIGYNTWINNNIVWRNVNVVDLQNKAISEAYFIVRNVDDAATLIDLGVEMPAEQNFLENGQVWIDLGRDLFTSWLGNGAQGYGIGILGHLSNTVQVKEPDALIEGIPLDAGEEHEVSVTFLSCIQPGIYDVNFIQHAGGERVGGVTYQLDVAGYDNPFIRGQVSDAAGIFLPDIDILLYRQDEGSLDWDLVNLATTDSYGIFRFVTGSGLYKVFFNDPAGEYAPEFYHDAINIDAAVEIPIVDRPAPEIYEELSPMTPHHYLPQIYNRDPLCRLIVPADSIYVLGGLENPLGDFEDPVGIPDDDGWTSVDRSPGTGVGDYAMVWPFLQEIDPCCNNNTPQFAFIDHPSAGGAGYLCVTWCYGPEGYVINPAGGLSGDPDAFLWNEIWSPTLTWPVAVYDGAVLEFDVYHHENLTAGPSPGMFATWHIRSTADPAGVVDWSSWQDRELVYYGNPTCVHVREDVTNLLVPNRSQVQIALGVIELGWAWGFTGIDATPSPYYDNVSLLAFAQTGPSISAREVDLAQDNFPEIGALDCQDPCQNSIRFDMARNIASTTTYPINLPGDSILFDVLAVRTGSMLAGPPNLCYRLDPNPLFDSCRLAIPPGAGNTSSAGCVAGWQTLTPQGNLVPDRYSFDLPDSGFFFPGDVIHYYILAEDDFGGLATLPCDTSGFGFFPGDPEYVLMEYPHSFIVRGLPAVSDLETCEHPSILWWNDFGSRGLTNEWMHSFWCLGFQEGVDYDIYYTNGPTSGVGNGLGGRATTTQLAGYDVILYSAGDLSQYTLSNGDYDQDPSRDLEVLDNWLRIEDRCLFLTGNNLISGLSNAGPMGQAFKDEWIQVDLVGNDIRQFIGNTTIAQADPLSPSNPVFFSADRWGVFTLCNPHTRYPDAVLATGNAVRLAEWLDLYCEEDAYPYAAATLTYNPVYNSQVIYLPYDLGWIVKDHHCGDDPPPNPISPVRAEVLRNVILFCGYAPGMPPIVETPAASEQFNVRCFPNPFNPNIRIEYKLPRDGHLVFAIYNIRGELIKTLLDKPVAAGSGHVVWDGTDETGEMVSSGVYFYVADGGGDRVRGKIALIK